MIVIDDFVNTPLQKEIENYFLTCKSWEYCKYTSAYDTEYQFVDNNTCDSSQFVYQMTSLDSCFPKDYLIRCLEDYFDKSYSDRMLRVKANMILRDKEYKSSNYNIPHVDSDTSSESVIYYVNDSDGDTIMFNERANPFRKDKLTNITIKDRITPKRGRIVVFDSTYLHASSPPIINSERIVVNLVFKNNAGLV